MLKAFIKETPFGLSILLFTLAIGLLILIAPIGGKKTLIVRSGSMQPAINVGDLITVKPQTNYKIGNIIAFRDPLKSNQTVTHRIVDINSEEEQIFYQVKGDANEEADINLVPKENVIGRADSAVHGIGRIFAQVKTRNGFLATAIIPAAFVILLEIASIVREVRKGKKSSSVIPANAGIQIANIVQDDIRRIQNDIRYDFKKVKSLYEHYGKPMGLPHPSASFASLLRHILRAKREVSLKTINISSGKFSRSLSRENLRGSNNIYLFALPILTALLVIGSTWAFSEDIETSQGNTLTAASLFPSPTPDPVVINEFLANGSPEWVEFYNPNPDAEFIKSYWIDDDTDFGPDGIGQGSNKKQLTDLNTSSVTFPTTDLTTFLNNDDDNVVIFDNIGNILDQFTYPPPSPQPNVSIGRQTDGTGAFQTCGASTKGATNNGSC